MFETKEFFVSPANSSLVGILITIGGVIDIFAIVYVLLYLDQFRILGSGLALACNGGSCGGISLKRD